MPEVEDPAEPMRRALAHQRACLERGRRFCEALDAPATPPDSLRLVTFVGDTTETPADIVIDAASGEVLQVGLSPGDGSVTRASARLDGAWTRKLRSPIAWDQVTFLPADHLGLTSSPTVTDNVLYLLLEDPRSRGAAALHEAAPQRPR